MVKPRQKSELLSNIEDLWQEAAAKSAEHKTIDAQSTFQRISALMEEAVTTAHLAANDAETSRQMAQPQEIPSQEIPSQDITPQEITSQEITSQDITSQDNAAQDIAPQDDTFAALGHLVEEAAENAATTAPDQPFEQVKSRMDDVAQLKPPQADSFNSDTPEYAFGNAFTNLVRHVVRDYIHKEVEGVIRNAIKSELDAHFSTDTTVEPGSDDGHDDGTK
ncbi:MAG: hypothetical protein J4F41_04985 [Alphaproteobacteria bacterium]|nr:hypothetical protein [Alphaproteobacteria bacterium]